MKKLTTLLSLALMLAAGAWAVADHHEGSSSKGHGLKWFDAENCTVCKPMGERPDLMMAMQWETHKIDDGMVMVAVVPEGKEKEYEKICAKMMEIAGDVEAGKIKDAKCCGFCDAMSGVMKSGAKEQKLKTKFGEIALITAADEATVKRIHTMADRTIEEGKKWEKMMEAMKKAAG